jgi:hypothetical protein
MILSNEIAAFWKTRTFVKSAEFEAAGWDHNVHDIEESTGPQVYSYLYDHATGWTWLCTSPVESFNRAAESTRVDATLAEAARSGLGEVLSRAADGSPPGHIGPLSWQEQLALLAATYAGTTKTWAAADRFAEGGHFVVIHYRASGALAGALRPFALNYGQQVIPAGMLLESVQKVISLDSVRHPDWLEGRVA